MKDKFILSDKEKFAATIAPNAEAPVRALHVNEDLKRAKTEKLNDEISRYEEALAKQEKATEDVQKSLSYDVTKAEIKPIYSRILVKPLDLNPFQKIERKGSIILATGTMNLNEQFNEQTGKVEKQDQFIIVGAVQEVGPECKYLQPGDVIYYRKDTSLPVPFFGSGLQTIAENQVIAVVNEGLTERFK